MRMGLSAVFRCLVWLELLNEGERGLKMGKGLKSCFLSEGFSIFARQFPCASNSAGGPERHLNPSLEEQFLRDLRK